MEQILKTERLCKNFGSQKAVNEVSLNIQKNSVYGLLGPNGAGKSTILKMFSGIIRPTSGEIIFNGKKWNRNILNDIGVLIENPPLYDNLSAFDNLKVRTLALGIPEHRIFDVLNIVNLRNTGKKKAKQFSLGMKQRLGIACSLLSKPNILILDEPTNGLDHTGIMELRNILLKLKEDGICILISSHNLYELENICNRVYFMDKGRIVNECNIDNNSNLEDMYLNIIGGLDE